MAVVAPVGFPSRRLRERNDRNYHCDDSSNGEIKLFPRALRLSNPDPEATEITCNLFDARLVTTKKNSHKMKNKNNEIERGKNRRYLLSNYGGTKRALARTADTCARTYARLRFQWPRTLAPAEAYER